MNSSLSLEGKAAFARHKPYKRAVAYDSTDEECIDSIFLDSSRADEYLKDLINVGGLKESWGDIALRLHKLEQEHRRLDKTANQQAMKEMFIMRPEYEKKVEQAHEAELKAHQVRLHSLENGMVDENETVKSHGLAMAAMDKRLDHLEETLQGALQNITRLEEHEHHSHEAVLRLIRQLGEHHRNKEEALEASVQAMSERLARSEEMRRGLAENLRRQQEFLDSDQLASHIMAVCRDALTEYVAKEDMLSEVNRTASFLVAPIMEEFEKLKKETAQATRAFHKKNDSFVESIKKVEQRIVSLDQLYTEKFVEVWVQFDLRATTSVMFGLTDELHVKLRTIDICFRELKGLTTHKVQEVVERLSEFQTILEDHEHALQHHAEEILNRSTKYDLVVCQQRLDKCALVEKVEMEIKDLQNTTKWQSAKLENMSYHKSLSNSRQSPNGSHQGSTGNLGLAGDSKTAPTEMSTCDPGSLEDGMQVSLNPTAHYSLMQDQLESVAQALIGLGHLALKSACPGLSREVRQERESELMHHLSCLLHWVMHRKAPASWDPFMLTTIALDSMKTDDEPPPQEAEKFIEHGPASAAHRAAAAAAAPHKALSSCCSRRFRRPDAAAASTSASSHNTPLENSRFRAHISPAMLWTYAARDGGRGGGSAGVASGTPQKCTPRAHSTPMRAATADGQEHRASTSSRAFRPSPVAPNNAGSATPGMETFSNFNGLLPRVAKPAAASEGVT